MKYKIKDIFGPTIQGEGALMGTPCAFLRFSKCNLWDGREESRHLAECKICDTDFLEYKKMTAEQIVKKLKPYRNYAEWLVVSGGEPLLQFDFNLASQLDEWKICVETNGTQAIDFQVDHVSFSPKTKMERIKLKKCDSLKILWPDPLGLLQEFDSFPAKKRFLQPINGQISSTLDKLYELGGRYLLSPQLHKYIGVM
jgi:organic radical activating enzyme